MNFHLIFLISHIIRGLSLIVYMFCDFDQMCVDFINCNTFECIFVDVCTFLFIPKDS